mgnify:CR=1 FL=1
MAASGFDVLCIGNAIVDVLSHADDAFLSENQIAKGGMTLIDADRAYLSSGGSFQAVVVSLLTSDSMMYRK